MRVPSAIATSQQHVCNDRLDHRQDLASPQRGLAIGDDKMAYHVLGHWNYQVSSYSYVTEVE
ncbi:hypothetical protein FUT69_09705 [Xylella taiwanensis]|uniref:Uncharacterized protein n=1 Tax=Xylella taiwanensis TaxID=1444770 RepID=Z9JKK7_9GAMM|nr:hypothetical protein [Xylella taiwanensis]AXI83001.1 hypothetical protein AB672_03080 [Xylella taiwanensis]EWS78503.1 hypothetical protein AF72_05835 [Xylella taiwanensis]MCD8456025.1 hypothetical protein [Xylella taiwanensis]MCD8458429.1 hypothetical protein [Xylella taiwanensis]MCD8460566.1 hypothetical protein [Xylella taiwanensis]